MINTVKGVELTSITDFHSQKNYRRTASEQHAIEKSTFRELVQKTDQFGTLHEEAIDYERDKYRVQVDKTSRTFRFHLKK